MLQFSTIFLLFFLRQLVLCREWREVDAPFVLDLFVKGLFSSGQEVWRRTEARGSQSDSWKLDRLGAEGRLLKRSRKRHGRDTNAYIHRGCFVIEAP